MLELRVHPSFSKDKLDQTIAKHGIFVDYDMEVRTVTEQHTDFMANGVSYVREAKSNIGWTVTMNVLSAEGAFSRLESEILLLVDLWMQGPHIDHWRSGTDSVWVSRDDIGNSTLAEAFRTEAESVKLLLIGYYQ